MIFEDALKQMREGKKIRHPHWEPDEYLMGCYVTFLNFDDTGNEKPLTPEQLEDAKLRGMSIVKMKGEFKHPDMSPGRYREELCKHGLYPQLNLLLIMQDNWEVME